MRFAAGDTIGRYEIASVLGAGAMGEVYCAHDPLMQRNVAIKVLSNPTLDDESLARFSSETRMVASLSHPHVVAIHDVGTIDGVPYAVMEWLDGETLRARLARGPLPIHEAVAFARQIADALVAAHAKQIVHRDLKPENVFIVGQGQIKLLDFGIAKAPPGATNGTSAGTIPGLVIGTIGYMAPEQARGLPTDARADIYAFGAVLFEMLSGQAAFPGTRTVDMLVAIVRGEAKTFEPESRVPQWLQDIVRRCMQTDPTARFDSAPALVDALREAQPQQARVEPAAAGEPEPRSIAVLPFADMSRDRDHAYLCEGMAEEILTVLGRIPGLRVASRTASFRFGGAEVDARHAGEALNVAYVLEGSIRTAPNRLRVAARLTKAADGYVVWSRQFDRDLSDIFELQDELARTIVDTLHPAFDASASVALKPATMVMEAYTAYLKGRYHWNRRTEDALAAAIGYFSQAIAADPQYANALAGLADANATLGLYGLRAPHDVMTAAKAMAQRALRSAPHAAEARVSLAFIEAVYDWEWAQAERDFHSAIQLDPQYATAYQWYASNCLVPQGRFDEARRMMAYAIDLEPASLPIAVSSALISFFEGDFGAAASVFRTALDRDPSFAPGHFFLAQALAESGETADAMRHAEQGVLLSGRSAETLGGLGYVAAVGGDEGRAQAVLDELRELGRQRYVSPGIVAQVLAGLRRSDETLAALKAAVDLRASDLAWCAVRPAFRSLRTHPGFAAIVNRLGLRLARTS